jgi:hypothetical protein
MRTESSEALIAKEFAAAITTNAAAERKKLILCMTIPHHLFSIRRASGKRVHWQ